MDMDKIEQLKIELQSLLQQGKVLIVQIPPIQLYIAIAVFFFTMAFLSMIRLFSYSMSNTIVLTGHSGSGKTVIFYQLRDGSSHQGTVTSMELTEGSFILHSEKTKRGKVKPVHVVDFPGRLRLRPKLNAFLSRAAGIVFVVDAMEFLPNCRATSEYLYDILSNAFVVKKKIPVLILCNKVDKVTAHSKEFIRKQLEKEIDKIRASRSGVSAADIGDGIKIGVSGEAFAFSQCDNKKLCNTRKHSDQRKRPPTSTVEHNQELLMFKNGSVRLTT